MRVRTPDGRGISVRREELAGGEVDQTTRLVMRKILGLQRLIEVIALSRW
jgi:hypothetical protein